MMEVKANLRALDSKIKGSFLTPEHCAAVPRTLGESLIPQDPKPILDPKPLAHHLLKPLHPKDSKLQS